MLQFDDGQRAALSETVRELANLAAAALVVGQLVSERPLSWQLITTGTAIWIGFVGFALFLQRRRT